MDFWQIYTLAIAFSQWGLEVKEHIFTNKYINGRNLRYCHLHLLWPFSSPEVTEKNLNMPKQLQFIIHLITGES